MAGLTSLSESNRLVFQKKKSHFLNLKTDSIIHKKAQLPASLRPLCLCIISQERSCGTHAPVQ